MEWYQTVFEVIDMRSFSNLWFWIMLAVMWSSTSHRVVGVPFDMINRAAKVGGQMQQDLEALSRIYVNRILYIADVAGMWLTGLAFFALSMLATVGFLYGVEFCQALFLIAGPMALVGALSVRTARVIRANDMSGDRLRQRLLAHRRYTQLIGMLSILVTSFWGMHQNLSIGVLGG